MSEEAHEHSDDEDLARTQEALEAEREAIDEAASELEQYPLPPFVFPSEINAALDRFIEEAIGERSR